MAPNIAVISVILSGLFILTNASMVEQVNSETSKIQMELTGCGKFLDFPDGGECEATFTRPVFNEINSLLTFKSKYHEAAFWLGFSVPNFLECKNLAVSGNTTNPSEIFKRDINPGIDIGRGSINREKDAPYSLAYHAGEALFFEVQDAFGTNAACKMILDAARPDGPIANLVKSV